MRATRALLCLPWHCLLATAFWLPGVTVHPRTVPKLTEHLQAGAEANRGPMLALANVRFE